MTDDVVRPGLVQRLEDMFDDGQRFFRGTFLGHTFLLVLLGAGSTGADATPGLVLGLLLVGLCYHCFGYVHNDLIDLPVDRRQPLRAEDPLVRGRIAPAHAWAFALIQVPVAFAVAVALEARTAALVVLAVGFGATVVYNLYGKRCPVPVVTDAVQGVAWSSLALFGVIVAGDVMLLSAIPVSFGFAFIFLINGVHGGLRDLANDLAQGRRTTAIYFGARPTLDGGTTSTPALQRFAWTAFAILVLPGGALLFSGAMPYDGATLAIVVALWAAVNLRSAVLLAETVRLGGVQRREAIYAHQFYLLAVPLLLMAPAMALPLALTVLAAFFLPLLVFHKVRRRRMIGLLARLGGRPQRRFLESR